MALRPNSPNQSNRYLPNVMKSDLRREATVTHGEKEFGSHTEGLVLRDTFFNTELTKWLVRKHYDYDKKFLDDTNDAILENITRIVALQMSIDDLGNSITDLGITDFDMSGYSELVNKVGNMIALRTLDRFIVAAGLEAYREEIMLREIENTFGNSRRLAAVEKKDALEKSRISASQHNILERIMGTLEEMRDRTKQRDKTDTKTQGGTQSTSAKTEKSVKRLLDELRAPTQE